jgi:hypothetical protein
MKERKKEKGKRIRWRKGRTSKNNKARLLFAHISGLLHHLFALSPWSPLASLLHLLGFRTTKWLIRMVLIQKKRSKMIVFTFVPGPAKSDGPEWMQGLQGLQPTLRRQLGARCRTISKKKGVQKIQKFFGVRWEKKKKKKKRGKTRKGV